MYALLCKVEHKINMDRKKTKYHVEQSSQHRGTMPDGPSAHTCKAKGKSELEEQDAFTRKKRKRDQAGQRTHQQGIEFAADSTEKKVHAGSAAGARNEGEGEQHLGAKERKSRNNMEIIEGCTGVFIHDSGAMLLQADKKKKKKQKKKERMMMKEEEEKGKQIDHGVCDPLYVGHAICGMHVSDLDNDMLLDFNIQPRGPPVSINRSEQKAETSLGTDEAPKKKKKKTRGEEANNPLSADHYHHQESTCDAAIYADHHHHQESTCDAVDEASKKKKKKKTRVEEANNPLSADYCHHQESTCDAADEAPKKKKKKKTRGEEANNLLSADHYHHEESTCDAAISADHHHHQESTCDAADKAPKKKKKKKTRGEEANNPVSVDHHHHRESTCDAAEDDMVFNFVTTQPVVANMANYKSSAVVNKHANGSLKMEKHKIFVDRSGLKEDEKEMTVNEEGTPKESRSERNQAELQTRPTFSIAVAGSIVNNAQSLKLATMLAGQIARAATIFRVDEIVVFDDYDDTTSSSFQATRQEDYCEELGGLFMLRILKYLEMPQYLRRALIPMHRSLGSAGKLPPLDAPHHLRKHEWLPFREGVVLDKRPLLGSGSCVDVGLDKEVVASQKLKPGMRVTVAMGHTRADGNVLQVVDRETVRQAGFYWGYTVRYASCLSAVFDECPFEGKYDFCIGTSEHGEKPGPTELVLPKCKHLLVAFGGLSGLEESVEIDKRLQNRNVRSLFNRYINTCPNQGSRTIRTEEAILISLQFLQAAVQQALSVP